MANPARNSHSFPWDVDAIADTPYDPTRYRDHLFVAPGFTEVARGVVAWLGRF